MVSQKVTVAQGSPAPAGRRAEAALRVAARALSGGDSWVSALGAALDALVDLGLFLRVEILRPDRGDRMALLVSAGAAPDTGDALHVLARQALAEGQGLLRSPTARGRKGLLVAAPIRVRGEGTGVLAGVGADADACGGEGLLTVSEDLASLFGPVLACIALEERLQAREEERRALVGRLIGSQEEERRRIARGLHDEISQTLLALSLRVDALRARYADSPAGKGDAGFNRLRGAVDDALEEVHRIIFDLRPTILDDMGLVPAVMWVAQRHLQRRGVEVSVEVNGRQRRLPEAVETVAFRVVQEAIQNIHRHAQAHSAHLALTFRPDALEVLVVDDGRGFHPEEVPGRPGTSRGLGLLGMRERLALVDGTLNITSRPGRGTSLLVHIPVPPEEEEGVYGSDSDSPGG